ncbi:MAG: protein kinase [Planctomycetes bacterium]|nr:protein kinase [Planctomycetota bacterium]
MSRIKNLLFGKLAVSTKFITEEQLDECLLAQREIETRGEVAPRLGEILEQKGYLTRQQIRSLLETMQSMQRRLFGEIGVTFHFVTLEQVQTALEIQRYLKNSQETVPLFGQALVTYRQFLKNLKDAGTTGQPRIGEVLIAMGYLKAHQVERIVEEQSKKLVDCDNCGASLNISKFKVGQKIKCGQCATILALVHDEAGNVEARMPQEAGAALIVGPPSGQQIEMKEKDADKDKAAEINLQKSTTLGDFQIMFRLGQDSTGILYKAQQISKNRPVVLKMMNPSAMEDAAFAKRFMDEARKMAGLDHPAIKRIYSIGKINEKNTERVYVAMEFVEGESVHKLLEREGKLPYPHALGIVRQVADALAFAWQNGVLHTDIRPSNILILPSGEIKVAQLGLASKSTENILTISKSGQLAPFYIAPEQVTEDRELDCRTDIYSLGASLFHMITGRPPYQGQSPFEILVRLTEETIPPLKFFDPTIPDGLCKMVERMLEAEPEERYQTYDELLRDLAEAEAGGPIRPSGAMAAPDPGATPQRPMQYLGTPGEGVPQGELDAATFAGSDTAKSKGVEARGAAATQASRTPALVGGAAVIALLIGLGMYYAGSGPTVDPTVKTDLPLDVLRKAIAAAGEDYPAALEHIDRFLRDNPADPGLPEAKRMRAAKEADRDARCESELEAVRTAVKDALADERYAEALTRYDAWPTALKTTDWTEKLAREREKTRQQIVQKFAADAAEIRRTCEADHDFDTARSALGAWTNRFAGLDDLLAQVTAEAATIDELERKVKEAEKQHQTEAEFAASKKIYDEAREAALSGLKVLNLPEAEQKVTAAEAQVTMDEHKRKLADLKRELSSIGDALERTVSRGGQKISDLVAASATPEKFPLVMVPDKAGKLAPQPLRAIDTEGMEVGAKPEDARRLTWAEVPRRSLYELASMVATQNSGQERYDLAIFCLRSSLYAEAEKEFSAAIALGTERGRVKPYLDEIDSLFAEAAAKCLAQAQATKAKGDVAGCMEALLTLKNSYAERDFTRKNAAVIEQLLKEALQLRIAEVPSAKPPDFYDWEDAPQLGRWTPIKGAIWAIEEGQLHGKGRQGGIERKGEAPLAELAGLVYVAAGGLRPTVLIRLGAYELKIMDSGAVYFKDVQANIPRNSPEVIQANTWYQFRIWKQRQAGKDVITFALNDKPLTSFDATSARTTVTLDFEVRGTALAGAPPAPSSYVRFDNVVIRPEE